jgi:hypothetical protein
MWKLIIILISINPETATPIHTSISVSDQTTEAKCAAAYNKLKEVPKGVPTMLTFVTCVPK